MSQRTLSTHLTLSIIMFEIPSKFHMEPFSVSVHGIKAVSNPEGRDILVFIYHTSLFHPVVRGLLDNIHIMNMGLLKTSSRYQHEPWFNLKFSDIFAAQIPHA
jgi:hypothetical protein